MTSLSGQGIPFCWVQKANAVAHPVTRFGRLRVGIVLVPEAIWFLTGYIKPPNIMAHRSASVYDRIGIAGQKLQTGFAVIKVMGTQPLFVLRAVRNVPGF